MAKVKIEKMTHEEVRRKGIDQWPVWTREPSRFDWTYHGDEECYIIAGEFTVETNEGTFSVKPGDFVTFKDGLNCVWDISRPVKKYYNFP
jgi:uncharacterized cupin superfamily protein